MDCSEILEQLDAYLDQDARAELCRKIEEHLQNCRDCRVEVDSLQKTIILYHNDRETPVPAGARLRLHQALAQVYRRGA